MKNSNTEEARDKAYADVKMYVANDWELSEETPEAFILKRNEASFLGHVFVFFFTCWFTLGLGNVVYHFAKRKKKKILK